VAGYRDFFPLGGRQTIIKRIKETADGNNERALMKLVHSVRSESRPGAQPSSGTGPQFQFDRPARELPTRPFKCFPLGPTSRDECGTECAAADDFFPLGSRSMVTVKENGGREKTRG
jgi:hypothetical protein